MALTGTAFSGYLLWAQLGRIHAICIWCVGNDVVMATLAVLCSARFLREPDSTADDPARVAALRGDVRHLGHPVPDDPRRRPRADARDARLRAHRARGGCSSCRPRPGGTSSGRSSRVWWPLLALHGDRDRRAVAPARAGRDEAHELADRPAVAARAARRRRHRPAHRRPGADGRAALARPPRRDRAASPRSSGSTSAASRALPVAEVGAVAVCYAIGPIILSRSLADVPALGVVAARSLLTAVVYAPVRDRAGTGLVAAAERRPVRGRPGGDLHRARVPLFLALIAEAGPVRATVITYVNPAVAAILGVSILGEKLTAGMGVGFVLVLVGLFPRNGRARARRRALTAGRRYTPGTGA